MPKRIVRIIRKRVTRALQIEIEFSRIHRYLGRGLGRTLGNTLDLMPLDADLLLKQGKARSKYLNRQLAWRPVFKGVKVRFRLVRQPTAE